MAAREAVYITATALYDNLQTKLDALSVEAGEDVPTIADFRDVFSDDVSDGPDTPRIVTGLDPVGDTGEFESFSKFDIRVPLVVSYQTTDPDTAHSRATASYVFRGIMQVLNDVSQQSRNSVQFIQYLDPRVEIGRDDQGHVGLDLRFVAQMRDNAP